LEVWIWTCSAGASSGVGAGVPKFFTSALPKFLLVENPGKIQENAGKIPENVSTDLSTASH